MSVSKQEGTGALRAAEARGRHRDEASVEEGFC